MDKQPDKILPPVNKEQQHFNPDSLFKKDKLTSVNADGKTIRFWKVTYDNYVGYGECLQGEDKPDEAIWVGPTEYLKYQVGDEEFERLKKHFRDIKRMMQVVQLREVRNNNKELVDKINKK